MAWLLAGLVCYRNTKAEEASIESRSDPAGGWVDRQGG